MITYVVLLAVLGLGIWVVASHKEGELMAMGIEVGPGSATGSQPVRNAAARRAIELTIRQIQALAFEHGFLVPTELELRRMDRVRLGRELGVAEEKARRAKAQAGVGRAAGVERVVGV